MKTFKLLPRLFAAVGVMMMFTVSGWGAASCTTTVDHAFTTTSPDNNHTFATSSVGSDKEEFYYISVPVAGILTLSNLSANTTIYYSRTGCATTSSTTVANGGTITLSSSGNVYLLARSANANAAISFTLTFVPTVTPPTISFTTTTNGANEGNSGTTNIPYTVTLNVSSATAISVPYTIAGSGANAANNSDFVATSGTLNFAAGVTSQILNVPVQGDMSYESNETFTVTLGTPTGATLGSPSSATGTITNDDPIPSLSVSNVSQAEGSGGIFTSMVFTGILSNPSSTSASVNYATANGTAASGTDYTGQSGLTLIFNPGETTKTLSVPIWGDTGPESDENFTVSFSSPSGLTLPATPYLATGTILNDDLDVPNITIADQSINESNSGTTSMIFTVTVTNMKTTNVTVNYATSDGTALAVSDYIATFGSVTFTPGGSATQTITIPIVGDSTVELLEQFYVILSNATGSAVINDNNATGTINDNDTSATCSPYIGQMTINEYNFIPGVKDEFGNQIVGTGDFIELKVIGQTLRDAILNNSHFIDNWKLEVHNNAGGVTDGIKLLPEHDPLCDFNATGYLIYTFDSAVLKEGPITLVVKDDQNRTVDILYYGNDPSLYTPSTCSFVYDTNMTESTSQNKDVFRLPDGTGDWTDYGSGANSGATRCTNPGGGFEGIHTIFDAFDYKTSVTNADIGRPITTKIVNKPIALTAISTNSTHTALANSVKVAAWLARKSGSEYYLVEPLEELEFKNTAVNNIPNFTRINAGKDHVIAFKYCDDTGLDENVSSYKDWDECWPQGITAQQRVAISWDNFAIRPNVLSITSVDPHMPNFLRSGEDYNTTIHAYQYGSTVDTPDYNVTNAQMALVITPTKYNRNNVDATLSMAGTTSFATAGFDMENGLSKKSGVSGEVAGLTFSDVGKINIRLEDHLWSEVDNDDTPMNCDANGTYVCGDKNVTFIPHHFSFSSLGITNNNGSPGTFTYIANEVDQMAGRIYTTMRAENKLSALTSNFTSFPLWENNVTVMPVVVKATYLYPDANESNITNLSIGFLGGAKTIAWDESNTSQDLRFNFRRDVNLPQNSFDVNGTDLNISMTSHYVDTSFTPNHTADINGSRLGTGVNNLPYTVVSPADGNTTFVYGRIIPRDVRVFGANTPFTANGWYEVYNTPTIAGMSLTGSRNDSSWFINRFHSDVPALYDGDANVTILEASGTPSSVNVGGNAVVGIETYTFSAMEIGGYKAHINTDPWLWYGVNALTYHDPDGTHLDCLTHPCFNINVVSTAGATGSAKLDNEDTKDSKASTSEGTWKSTTDYAPAIR